MHFTVFTDYAFRVLIYLALEPDSRVTINDIAESYSISKNHLMKVANLLAQAGVINSSRGSNGGLELARQADKIMVGEIVRLTEDSFQPVECFKADNQCIITPACGLRVALGDALQAFNEVLDNYSIQDLIGKKVQLKKLCKRT
ncbi:MAG: Rrf2 family transcriptional regulator [Gammaproteobacteria bacterium]|nr:Rrf2 family transcriptional regulator [Gammaproteobacteria bacterium]MCP4088263.1 Rrf2 family transcriptional regulator [Gammaproteobacteria bacterium]MCP4276426.1 Rrf2 family transcriptional regulator [Gammaproteobacteria bacterium]MCP4831073.1 Rrf2 family transcriptional regulator [Gammaproteobacteria bacterium]MCP4929341.1 Rrf2 family transcriptional regulator [Gammaproteobacteria bacterium]